MSCPSWVPIHNSTLENLYMIRALCHVLFFCPMFLSFLLAESAAAQPQEPLRAIFLNIEAPNSSPQLAVHWTGDPNARLSVWLDLDGDGRGQDSELVIRDVLLRDEMKVFELEASFGTPALEPHSQALFRVTLHDEVVNEFLQLIREPAPSVGPGTGPEHCEWSPDFYQRDLDGAVESSAIFDDGTGPALFVGGSFGSVNATKISNIAKWDGTSWHPLGSGTNGTVYALTVYDDGSGPALYAAGSFTEAGGVSANRIARWDGTAWHPLGQGVGTFRIHKLTVYDDGSGPALYAGGYFSEAGGAEAHNIAKWDGAAWSAVGSGVNDQVHDLHVFDDGNGSALYVGGRFFAAGATGAQHLAKWDGSAWSAVGSGSDQPIRALHTFDDGSGPALYIGGEFTTVDGVAASRIAKWDGTQWSSLDVGANGWVYDLAVYDDGGGSALYAVGSFPNAGGISAGRVAKWDGTQWHSLNSQIENTVYHLNVFDDGSGSKLYVGGLFTIPGEANHIATWDGSAWSALSSSPPTGLGLSSVVEDFAFFDDGNGPALYAAGHFRTAGGVAAQRLAKWDGTSWHALGSGIDNAVLALAVFDDGSGPALYAGGFFFEAGGVPAKSIAKWDGSAWSPLGSALQGLISDLVVFDDGGGPALYASGHSLFLNGSVAGPIVKWDGSSWSTLDASLGFGVGTGVSSLAVFDDGNGPDLYAAGNFTTIDGVQAANVAKWNGTSWSSLGGGTNNRIRRLATLDDGNGPALYVGGDFTSVDGIDAHRIAKWNGTDWSAMGAGFDNYVFALGSFDDGSGPAIYAGGFFRSSGATPVNRLARWDGSQWQPMGAGVNGPIDAMMPYDDGRRSSFYIGGSFTAADGLPSMRVAKYTCFSPPSLSLPALTHTAVSSWVEIPIELQTGGRSLDSATFSIDYDETCLNPDLNGDGVPDHIELQLPELLEVDIAFDPLDTDGELDLTVSLLEGAGEGFPNRGADDGLPDGALLTIGFQATCSAAPGSSTDAAVDFSLDPEVGFGTSLGQNISGNVTNGVVRIWSGDPGDCNADGMVDSGDLEATALEIFDADGEAWLDAPGGTFSGSPVGCDANADLQIRAADLVCANLLSTETACDSSGDLQSQNELEISTRWREGVSWIRLEVTSEQLEPNNPIGGFALSLDFDPALFDLGSVDADADGVPDLLRFPQGQPGSVIVLWSDSDTDGELDLAIADLDQLPLPEGIVVEVGVPANHLFEGGITASQDPAPSFASPHGADLTSSVQIRSGIFVDGFESGDTSQWIGSD